MTIRETTRVQLSAQAADFLECLAAELDVPPSRYEQAEDRYLAVASWLGRDTSTLKDFSPDVYVQGSFRLGTPIRPVNGEEHYDIDLVCEFGLSKDTLSQQELKQRFGYEIQMYAEAHSMKNGMSEGRRCWTLEYADDAQFHLDALPALPDGDRMGGLLAGAEVDPRWAQTAIAITDNEHPQYPHVSRDWPRSNPKGYTDWFRSRMAESFKSRREGMALNIRANVEDIPEYRVKTPLQQAVQLLKRHRDIMFAADPDDKPISIIITTLAGLAYDNEAHVGHAVLAILDRMASYIEDRAGVTWIANPSNPSENFADRWQKYPRRKAMFHRWHTQAKADFAELAAHTGRDDLVTVAARLLGGGVAAAATSNGGRGSRLPFGREVSAFWARHKQQAPWPQVRQGTVSIQEAWIARNGYRRERFRSNGPELPKHAKLTFKAKTDVPAPYQVFWQVVNEGPEAAAVSGGLRGGFDAGTVERGSITHQETTLYAGSHTIECFIVKDRYLVARSGAFVVNIG